MKKDAIQNSLAKKGKATMNEPFLIGKNLYLRALRERDADGNYPRWLNDPEVCAFNSHYLYPYTKLEAVEYIHNINRSEKIVCLAICNNSDSHIGNVSLQNINRLHQRAEFAILIGERNFWGKGYALEAGRLILKHGFEQLNLNSVFCGTHADHTAMLKLAENLGFKKEGRQRQAIYKNGVFADVILYGLLRKDFK